MPIAVLSNLCSLFGPVRDQGSRPTCLAFAASDAHAALRSPWTPLSCEFVFYHAQRRAGRPPTASAVLHYILAALKEDGQPFESDWPYLESLPADMDDYGPPGKPAVFRRDGERRPDGFEEIIDQLESGRPVLILMMLSDTFYLPDANGVVAAPASEGPDPARRHALIAVGHALIDGARAVLVRNSWGTEWGLNGHAWLPETFIAPRLTRIALLTEEIHVPAKDLAA